MLEKETCHGITSNTTYPKMTMPVVNCPCISLQHLPFKRTDIIVLMYERVCLSVSPPCTNIPITLHTIKKKSSH